MIRTLIHGINFLLLFFLFSCKTIKYSKISKQNRIFYALNQPEFHYKNDSLKIGFSYYHFTGMRDQTYSKKYLKYAHRVNAFNSKKLKLIAYLQDEGFPYYYHTKPKFPDGIAIYELNNVTYSTLSNKLPEFLSPISKIHFSYFDKIYPKNKVFSRTFICKIDSIPLAFQVFTKEKFNTKFFDNFKTCSFELIDSIHTSKTYEQAYDNNLFDTAFAILKHDVDSSPMPSYLKFKLLFEENNKYYKDNTPEKAIRTNMLRYSFSFYHELDSIKNFQNRFQKNEKINIHFSPLQKSIHGKNKQALKKTLRHLLTTNDDENEMFEQIKNSKIVMINENHYDWRHRFHTAYLLDTLQQLGFHAIGIEALFNYDSIEYRKYPSINTGFYTFDPSMANLIRKAKKSNWNVFAYDYDSEKYDTITKSFPKINGREWGMALHIIHFIEQHPNEKILIHCGFGHLSENSSETTDHMWLGEILKKNFNINPVTIDQYFFDDLDVDYLSKFDIKNLFNYFSKTHFLKIAQSFQMADYYCISDIRGNDYCTNELYNKNATIIPLKKILDTIKFKVDCSIEIYPLEEVEQNSYLPCYLLYYNYKQPNIPEKLYLPEGKYVLYVRERWAGIIFQKII